MKSAWLLAFTLCVLAAGRACAETPQHELLIFGSAELARTPGLAEEDTGVDEEKVAADILFSVQGNSFKAFGEYLLTNHEADLERLQVGWEPSDHSVVWLGRFHQASSFWNHQHHHGQFLQTSVSRPASEEWEDEGGIVPQHFLGLLWESSWKVAGAYHLHSAIGAGLAPVMTPDGLEPFDLIKPNAAGRRLGVQARIAWQPNELEETGFGLLFGRNEIAATDAPQTTLGPFDYVTQTVLGAYAHAEWGDWKLQLTGYHVSTEFAGLTGAPRQNFLTAYAQVERDLAHGIDVFARQENTGDARDNLYLEMFPKFLTRKTTLGGRWQFARSHAITVEYSRAESRTHDYSMYRLQWSAALL